jgi:cytochrome c-type biogenesis protein CcmH/NrfG
MEDAALIERLAANIGEENPKALAAALRDFLATNP